MKLIIHDLTPEQEKTLLPEQGDFRVFSDDGTIRPCVGCFGCWVKTPGQCVIRDRYGDMGRALSECDELIILSRCRYGGFSPFVKNVMDRGISYVHPCFTIKNGEMHHRLRYRNSFSIRALFYGDDITQGDRIIARRLVNANAVNLHSTVREILFEEDPSAFGGRIL